LRLPPARPQLENRNPIGLGHVVLAWRPRRSQAYELEALLPGPNRALRRERAGCSGATTSELFRGVGLTVQEHYADLIAIA
jgi:hypothetical protein